MGKDQDERDSGEDFSYYFSFLLSSVNTGVVCRGERLVECAGQGVHFADISGRETRTQTQT